MELFLVFFLQSPSGLRVQCFCSPSRCSAGSLLSSCLSASSQTAASSSISSIVTSRRALLPSSLSRISALLISAVPASSFLLHWRQPSKVKNIDIMTLSQDEALLRMKLPVCNKKSSLARFAIHNSRYLRQQTLNPNVTRRIK